MIFFPWVVFVIGIVGLIIWGFRSKAEYLRSEREKQQRQQ
jgi:hypothetical protein